MPKSYHIYIVQSVLAMTRIEGCALHGFWWAGDYKATNWLVSRASPSPKPQFSASPMGDVSGFYSI